LVEAALAAQAAEVARIERLGGAELEPWAAFLRRGLADQARAELDWLTGNAARLV
jgi:hypothetical protein